MSDEQAAKAVVDEIELALAIKRCESEIEASVEAQRPGLLIAVVGELDWRGELHRLQNLGTSADSGRNGAPTAERDA
jgi:hypothetical protein